MWFNQTKTKIKLEQELDQMMATVLEQRRERVGTDKNDISYSLLYLRCEFLNLILIQQNYWMRLSMKWGNWGWHIHWGQSPEMDNSLWDLHNSSCHVWKLNSMTVLWSIQNISTFVTVYPPCRFSSKRLPVFWHILSKWTNILLSTYILFKK